MLRRKTTEETTYEIVVKPTVGKGGRVKVATGLIVDGDPKEFAEILSNGLSNITCAGDSLKVMLKPFGKKPAIVVADGLMIGKEALQEKISEIVEGLISKKPEVTQG